MSSGRKVLLLTGASRGIGHATVKRFSDAEWRIITCSREAVPEECKRDPNWTQHITADLGDPGDLDRHSDEPALLRPPETAGVFGTEIGGQPVKPPGRAGNGLN